MITALLAAALMPAHPRSAADLAGIDQAIRTVYDVISGPPGQKRDRGGTVEAYIRRNSTILKKEGFTDREPRRHVEIWGGLATAWSAYDGGPPTAAHERGINSFQPVKADGKWPVASILWQEATPPNPLPVDLIKGSKN